MSQRFPAARRRRTQSSPEEGAQAPVTQRTASNSDGQPGENGIVREEVDLLVDEETLARIMNVESHNICEKTRRGYESAIRRFKAWLRGHSAYSILLRRDGDGVNEEINLSLLSDVVFKAYLVQLENSKDPSLPIGISTYRTIRSALMKEFEEKGVPVPPSMRGSLKKLYSGYERIHADEKLVRLLSMII